MQRPTLLEGIFVALVASLAIGPLIAVLHIGLGAVMAWKGALIVVAYTYIVYLLARRGKMPGARFWPSLACSSVWHASSWKYAGPPWHLWPWRWWRAFVPMPTARVLCLACYTLASACWAWVRRSGPMRTVAA